MTPTNYSAAVISIRSDYREKYGIPLTFYKLAEILTLKCGRRIFPVTVQRIESGYTQHPKEDVARAIESLVHISEQSYIASRETSELAA